MYEYMNIVADYSDTIVVDINCVCTILLLSFTTECAVLLYDVHPEQAARLPNI